MSNDVFSGAIHKSAPIRFTFPGSPEEFIEWLSNRQTSRDGPTGPIRGNLQPTRAPDTPKRRYKDDDRVVDFTDTFVGPRTRIRWRMERKKDGRTEITATVRTRENGEDQNNRRPWEQRHEEAKEILDGLMDKVRRKWPTSKVTMNPDLNDTDLKTFKINRLPDKVLEDLRKLKFEETGDVSKVVPDGYFDRSNGFPEGVMVSYEFPPGSEERVWIGLRAGPDTGPGITEVSISPPDDLRKEVIERLTGEGYREDQGGNVRPKKKEPPYEKGENEVYDWINERGGFGVVDVSRKQVRDKLEEYEHIETEPKHGKDGNTYISPTPGTIGKRCRRRGEKPDTPSPGAPETEEELKEEMKEKGLSEKSDNTGHGL